MNITVAKIRELLVKDYGWIDIYIDDSDVSINEILDDTLKIIDDILKEHNVISLNEILVSQCQKQFIKQ
jgi:hypothetical protein